MPSSPSSADLASRLNRLRLFLRERGLDGFMVPMADAYQNEYVPPSAQRLAFLTGFTGSAGLAVVLAEKAAFFTDSRYTLQATQQIPESLYDIHDTATRTPQDWIKANLPKSAKLGFDPWLHTGAAIARLQALVKELEGELVPVDSNPVDSFWHDRPAPVLAPVEPYPVAYAGRSSADKRREIAEDLKKRGLDTALITDAASVAWLLNIRGGDVPHTPLPLGFALLNASGRALWFVDSRKTGAALGAFLGPDIEPREESALAGVLETLAGKRVLVDPSEAAFWILDKLEKAGARLERDTNPCQLPKACKNPVELEGMKAAHHRDGLALTRFLAWLDATLPARNLNELEVEEKLDSFRQRDPLYRGPSFATIAGAGPHGAIVHYRATFETALSLKGATLLLLDSGGQYLDGTTDVTRTIAVGPVTPEIRERATRVLKGHIALASARFPEGTTGADLDVLARQHLWAAGLDYGHGTGHGVGCYLGVHEGPQGISRRSTTPLRPGMVLSNEPGYYKAGAYGIRLENLQFVTRFAPATEDAEARLGFEPLTLVPFDRRLIEVALLTTPERLWLETYHAQIRALFLPDLDAREAAWLRAATAPLEERMGCETLF